MQFPQPDVHSAVFPWMANTGSARGLPVQEINEFGGSETSWPHCHK